MKKLLVGILSLVMAVCFAGCGETVDHEQYLDNNQKNSQSNQSDQSNKDTVSEMKEEIVLTTGNINEYLKIDYSVENVTIRMSTASNPPTDRGEGILKVKTTALKRGDFEGVTIKLNFSNDRGWGTTSTSLTIPYNGNIEENINLLSYNILLDKTPEFEMQIVSVSGKFVVN